MNIETITSLITSVGFPIVMVGVLCWYVYFSTNKLGKTLDEIKTALIHLEDSKDNEAK